MSKIVSHPILEIPKTSEHEFIFNNKVIKATKGFTIAAALHQAGYPVHSHSIDGRNRSLECGIGKCGACEMLVDGVVKRICITKVDNVKEVKEISKNEILQDLRLINNANNIVYKTDVVIIGAGPAGLATRELLNEKNINNIVIDNNDKIGGQFLMQTHQFFFFEKEKKYGGMRGYEIADKLAGDDKSGILLNSVVWDILEDKKIAVRNKLTNEIFYILTDYLVIATGAIPFLPNFKNDDLPGVYTAAVVQKMMNNEFTLLGKNILTVGAGNIGYLTSYQLFQAGANVKAIIEAMPNEGGFPVQANRVRRLGIPIMTGYTLLEAIPNEQHTAIVGAVIAKCENFSCIKGTEKIIKDIDAINICTGLVSDNQLFTKGTSVFGRNIYAIGDAHRIGEGTSAVLRGKQAAYEIIDSMKVRYNYNDYLAVSKEYIESQQHPQKKLDTPYLPERQRAENKPYIIIDCLYGFACNPCSFACPQGAITKSSTSSVPLVDYSKCIGCMDCVYQCPGLAIFGYNEKKDWIFLPIEYETKENAEVYLVDNNGNKIGKGIIEKILQKSNKTNIARVKSLDIHNEALSQVRAFIECEKYPEPISLIDNNINDESPVYICHCEDIKLSDILTIVGTRKYISIDEIKHTTRLGMGACRGTRCTRRLKQLVSQYGIEVTDEATPRAPLSNQVNIGDFFNQKPELIFTNVSHKKIKRHFVKTLVAGGGMAGSSVFRYLAEAGLNPYLINHSRGASWRNIAGGRPAFSLPALADIAMRNRELFIELQNISNIDYHPTRYISFVHDDKTYKALDASRSWSDAYMIDKKDFSKEISPLFNSNLNTYSAALISNNCWQATPGKTIDLIRNIGISNGGTVLEHYELIDIHKENSNFIALVKTHNGEYEEYETEHFVNALGHNAAKFANKLNLETGIYPVKHQAIITRRLPFIGKDNKQALDMLIDRRNYKGFSAVYGQQLIETGQIIACASPSNDFLETQKDLRFNSKEFIEIISEVFCNMIPYLTTSGIQACWAGYYLEPRYIVDPNNGLMIGMRGHGFMLSQYLGKLYVDKLLGRPTPDYFNDLALNRKGLYEAAFK